MYDASAMHACLKIQVRIRKYLKKQLRLKMQRTNGVFGCTIRGEGMINVKRESEKLFELFFSKI